MTELRPHFVFVPQGGGRPPCARPYPRGGGAGGPNLVSLPQCDWQPQGELARLASRTRDGQSPSHPSACEQDALQIGLSVVARPRTALLVPPLVFRLDKKKSLPPHLGARRARLYPQRARPLLRCRRHPPLLDLHRPAPGPFSSPPVPAGGICARAGCGGPALPRGSAASAWHRCWFPSAQDWNSRCVS